MLVMNFTLPQRFQLLNNLSALDAGVRLLPFGATFPVGAVFSAGVGGKLQVPGLFLAMFGAVIQVVGFALLSTLPSTMHIDPAIYGYEVLCGLGTGITYQILYLMVPFTADDRDKGESSHHTESSRVGGSALFGKGPGINCLQPLVWEQRISFAQWVAPLGLPLRPPFSMDTSSPDFPTWASQSPAQILARHFWRHCLLKSKIRYEIPCRKATIAR